MLAIDELEVNYVGEKVITHLINTLCSLYRITTDWTGSNYLGFKLN